MNVLNVVQLQTIATGLWILAMYSFGVMSRRILINVEGGKQ